MNFHFVQEEPLFGSLKTAAKNTLGDIHDADNINLQITKTYLSHSECNILTNFMKRKSKIDFTQKIEA